MRGSTSEVGLDVPSFGSNSLTSRAASFQKLTRTSRSVHSVSSRENLAVKRSSRFSENDKTNCTHDTPRSWREKKDRTECENWPSCETKRATWQKQEELENSQWRFLSTTAQFSRSPPRTRRRARQRPSCSAGYWAPGSRPPTGPRWEIVFAVS